MTVSVKQAILERRSIKKFNGQPVEKQAVLQILDDAKCSQNGLDRTRL